MGGIVASFAEAWIEILAIVSFDFFFTSPPSRRRGLKFMKVCVDERIQVASFTEVWIEISDCLSNELNDKQLIKSYLLCKKI